MKVTLTVKDTSRDVDNFLDKIQLTSAGKHNARYLHFMAHGKYPEGDPAPLFIKMALYMQRNDVEFSD